MLISGINWKLQIAPLMFNSKGSNVSESEYPEQGYLDKTKLDLSLAVYVKITQADEGACFLENIDHQNFKIKI